MVYIESFLWIFRIRVFCSGDFMIVGGDRESSIVRFVNRDVIWFN